MAPAAAGVLSRSGPALDALVAFGAFCLAASGTYLWNDVLDAEADRLHPDKRHRPVASGALGVPVAAIAGSVLLGGSLAVSFALSGWHLALVTALYVAVTLAYTLGVKRFPVVELAAVAAGFVLRAIAGGVATGVPLSSWFLVVTSFGALFVVVGKRMAEYRRLGESREDHRASLGGYTVSFLQSALTLTAAVTVTAYCLWAFDRGGLSDQAGHQFVWIQLTVAPVTIAVLHVLRLLDAGQGGAPEDLIFHDRLVAVLGLIWAALFAVGIYA